MPTTQHPRLSSRAILARIALRLEQGALGWIDQLSMYVRSDQASEEYAWLGMSPQMREWVGGRLAKGLRENGLIIKNKPFEATLEVSVDDLRRDRTGQLMLRVNDMADRANSHFASLLSTLLIGGETGLCYDGQYFFDTDHSEGSSGTQSNDISVDISALPVSVHGSTTAPSVSEMNAVILQGVQAILGFKDDQGEPMNENAREFMVQLPVPLWSTGVAAVGAQTMDPNVTNAIRVMDGYRLNIAPNPRLSWTDKIAVFRTDSEMKPFIRQEEVPPEVSAIAEGSELEFKHRKHEYGIFSSRNVGYGLWQQACLVTMT